MDDNRIGKWLLRVISYILVAALASIITLAVFLPHTMNTKLTVNGGKLHELKNLILDRYIGEADEKLMEDAAAAAMVAATGDRWSYYISADDMQAHTDQKANAYVGIGITITMLEDGSGFDVKQVEPGSPAQEGGLLPGDQVVAVDGQRISEIGTDTASSMVAGEENTTVDITYLRDGQEYTVTLTRKRILVEVASGSMLNETVGYIRIKNFDERCADETIALIDSLQEQGAKALVFDVRFNPGGYKDEMVKVLDYLLPEGVLFRSENYLGITSEDRSDAACQQLPLAVLINGDSYSAAEFFAAALVEYDYAFTVGEPTTGKGYFQQTLKLSDGSAVNLSVGKYYTPNGVSLAEVGGLVPDLTVETDEETEALIYSQVLPLAEDAQLQEAVRLLTSGE